MATTIKITDPNSKYFNQELKGCCIYYDIHHTGGPNVVDLFKAEAEDGTSLRFYSTQIDVPHYENQLLAERIKALGANVGDKVFVKEIGSGSYSIGWSLEVPHVITKITSSGQVEFDNGAASIFRPKVEVVTEN